MSDAWFEVCRRCEMRYECLATALADRRSTGFRAGTTAHRRAFLRTQSGRGAS